MSTDLDLSEAQVAGFMAVEDLLIEFRDSRISIFPYANGVVVNEKDGSPSPVVRMRTRHATDLAIETAAPLIEVQVRAQVTARAVRLLAMFEVLGEYGQSLLTMGIGNVAIIGRALVEAARIAKGESS